MTPQFTTACYVQVEDKNKRNEVCEKLDKLGYNCLYNGSLNDNFISTYESSYAVDYKVHPASKYNCGTNIDLFLSLAGMRSDTDRGQWFVEKRKNHKDKWVLCGCDKAPKSTPSKSILKATATEIVEHFNNK